MTTQASATTDNIFSGLKVVDLSSVIAAPAAAVILSDFGADVIKVEPPTGDLQRMVYKVPPEPRAKDNYPWHLDNRNKRGMVLDLKSPESGEVLERLVKWADVLIVNYPPATRKKLKLTYEEVAPWNPRLIYADLTGFGDKGPDAQLPGFDVTTFWARSSLLALTRDAGAPPTLPIAGSGDHATSVALYAAIVTGLYQRERTGKGSSVTTSLLGAGLWTSALVIQAALCDATFFPLHDRKNPPNATYNVYRTKDDKWFLMVTEPNRWPALVQAIDKPELLTDARFSDGAKILANSKELAAILDEVFSAKPMAYWQEVLSQARVTFGVVQSPADVTRDPQLFENEMIVPIQGAGGNLKSTVSSPIQVRNVTKVAAKRAPDLGEHNEEILRELGFNATEIDSLRATGAVPDAKHPEEAAAATKA
jgi:crotonobetainyl-CoA:carnitine CoA-transferase CaiB-like acyl-CoA transferase